MGHYFTHRLDSDVAIPVLLDAMVAFSCIGILFYLTYFRSYFC